jgi:hypothetical protein
MTSIKANMNPRLRIAQANLYGSQLWPYIRPRDLSYAPDFCYKLPQNDGLDGRPQRTPKARQPQRESAPFLEPLSDNGQHRAEHQAGANLSLLLLLKLNVIQRVTHANAESLAEHEVPVDFALGDEKGCKDN